MTTKRMKQKYIWAYFDGKPMVEVIQAALDNRKTVSDMKAFLVSENPGYTVTFAVTESRRVPTRSEARQAKMRQTVCARLHKLESCGWVFPADYDIALRRWTTPALFERLAFCDDRTFEEVAVPLARLEKAAEAV